MELMKKYDILTASSDKFYYMLLGRMESDCKYFLGNGHRLEKYLWAQNVKEHIALMREIWEFLPEKPEWLTLEQIAEYEKAMEG